MSISVSDSLKIKGLDKCKVIAGNEGLQRIIKCVDIFEVPDISRWLREGLMLLTTGYAIKDNPSFLIKLVKSMANSNCAALVIKDNRFLKNIPQEMIDIANELNFPVISLPNEIPYIDITHPLLNQVLANNYKENMIKEKFIHILTNSDNIDEMEILSLFHNVNDTFVFKPPYFMGILKSNRDNHPDNNKFVSSIKFNNNIIHIKIEEMYIIIGSLYKIDFKKNIENIIFLNKPSDFSNMLLLVSDSMKNLTLIKDVYRKLTESSQIINAIPIFKLRNIIFYEDLLPYLLLNKLNKQEQTVDLVLKLLSPILELDQDERNIMINTLYYYVKNLGNKSKAAKEAFLHRNTFNYRMEKLTKLLNSDLGLEEEIYKYKIILDLYIFTNKEFL